MLISVITAAYRPRPEHLADCYQSLLAQQLPVDTRWEWLVQGDGEDAVPLPDVALADPRVRLAHGPRGGPGTTRNLALERAGGELIANLDSDDTLTPTALAEAADVLRRQPDIGFTTSRALDLLPDGSLVDFRADEPSEALLPRGAIFKEWLRRDGRLPVHPATLCIRRELLLAVGGWMAMPTAEDAAMLFAANLFQPGWFIAKVGMHYRKHPGQLMADTSYTAAARAARARILRERTVALRDQLVRAGLPLPGMDDESAGPLPA